MKSCTVFRISYQFLSLAPCKSTCLSLVLTLNSTRLNLDRIGTALFFLLADYRIWLISSVAWYLEAWYQILEVCLYKTIILTSNTMSVRPLPSDYASLEEEGKEWKCWSKRVSLSTSAIEHPSWKCRRLQEAFKEVLLQRDFKQSSSQRRASNLIFFLNLVNQNDKQTTFPTRTWQTGRWKREVSLYLFLFKMT